MLALLFYYRLLSIIALKLNIETQTMITLNKKRLIITLVALTTVLILTHIPQEKFSPSLHIFSYDKLIHVVVYGVVTALALSALACRRLLLEIICVVIVLSLICVADEVTQPMFNRSCSLADWLADLAGILMVSIVYYIYKLKRRRAAA
jgi:VanZ family protein